MSTEFETIIDNAVQRIETNEILDRRNAYAILHDINVSFDPTASEEVMKKCLWLMVELSRVFDQSQSYDIHKPLCQLTSHIVKQINAVFNAMVPVWWKSMLDEFPGDEHEELTKRVKFFNQLGILMGH